MTQKLEALHLEALCEEVRGGEHFYLYDSVSDPHCAPHAQIPSRTVFRGYH